MRLAPLLLITACGGIPEDKYLLKSAEVSCRFIERCDTATFYKEYEDMGACVDASVALTDDLFGDCVYDDKAASKCLHVLKWNCKRIGKRWSDVVATCNAVYDCGEPVDTGAGTE